MFSLQAKLYVALAVIVALGGLYTYAYYDGRAACKQAYAEAQAKAKDDAQVKIVEADKKHEKVKYEIIAIQGENPVAGKRVTHAIDSLRNGGAGKR